MSVNVTSSARPSLSPEVRSTLLAAGADYGLLFGLGYALFVWGCDAWLLDTYAADVEWGVLLLGVLSALVIGGVAGFAGVRSPSVGVTVVVWVIASGLLGWITGRLPYTGVNLTAGMRDPRFGKLEILPYLQSNQSRTILLILANVAIGVVVGYVQTVAVERAWDRTTSQGRLSLRSWLALALAVLVAVPPAFAANALVLQPKRNAQRHVAELVEVVLSEGVAGAKAHGLNVTEAERYGERFAEDYSIYFTGFFAEGEALYSAYADVVFDDGLALRCIVRGTRVSFCADLAEKLDKWVGDLAHAGVTGEQQWLENPMKTFTVDDAVVMWLRAQGNHLAGHYTVERLAQMNSWMLVAVHFDSGFEMECRFHGAGVVDVDQCRIAENVH